MERRRGLRLVGRIVLWAVALLVMVVAGLAGGVYLFFHESVAAVRAKSPDVILAQQRLDVALPDKPAIALVIGYDRRFGEEGLPSRSDTIMLLRADPETKAVSMLSFPRDLSVPVLCQPGVVRYTGRINSAYAECGIKGTLETVKSLTGLPINYLITVNFKAFKQVVTRLGGVWVDVDRRYFNDNSGLGPGFNYAAIDLKPGYQLLSGQDALDFVRYRHADNDLYRNARQQIFVKALKDRLSHSFGPLALPRIVGAITHNVEVGVGGGGELSEDTVLRYALFAYYLPPGHFFQAKIDGLTGFAELYAPSANIQAAVSEFVSPDVEAPEKAAAQVGIHRKGKRKGPRPNQVTLVVLNGNDEPGAAANASYLLAQRGYQTQLPPNNLEANAPGSTIYFRTQVYYDQRQRGADLAARGLADLFGSADLHRGIPGKLRPYAGGAMAMVVVGQTFRGHIAPAPLDKTPPRAPAQVKKDIPATIGKLRDVRRRVPFTLMVPTVLERSSALVDDLPLRVYRLPGDSRGVRLTFKTSADVAGYWGIQQTDWDDAPVLAEKNFTHRFKDGRTYDLYFSGPKIHMVVLRHRGVSYWVVNTLIDTLSNETMLAIAKGLKPLPKK